MVHICTSDWVGIYEDKSKDDQRKYPEIITVNLAQSVTEETIIQKMASEDHPGDLGETTSDLDCDNLIETDTPNENLQETITQKLASVRLQLEVLCHVQQLMACVRSYISFWPQQRCLYHTAQLLVFSVNITSGWPVVCITYFGVIYKA